MVRRCACLCLLAVALAHADDGELAPITAADIAREKPVDLVALLRSRVGLDENNSVITMRGVKGIAIVVDGFVSSVAELKALKPEQVEKIEILRGGASARFGAEAMGGAIAVTTFRAGRQRSAEATLTAGLDSRLGHYTRLGGHGERDGLGWSLLAEDRVVEGFRTVPRSPFPYQITVDDERSKTRLFDAKLSWQGERLDVSLNAKRSDDWSYLGRPNWSFDGLTDNLRGQASWRLADGLALEAALGEERSTLAGLRDRGTGTDAAGLAPEYWLSQKSRQREASAALVRSGDDWQGRLGVNLAELDESFVNADYATRQPALTADSLIRKQALFVAGELPVAAGRLEFGLRHDRQEYVSARMFSAPDTVSSGGGVAKSALSPKLALGWPLGDGYRLRGSLGTGFSPPLASQLYNGYLGAGSVTLANPGLKPERSATADLALGRSGAFGEWSLTLFATRWQDKIAVRIVDYGMPVVQQPQNVGRSSAQGVEAQWSGRFADAWSLSANATWSRTRIDQDLADPALVGKELPDMPRLKANLALAWAPADDFSARARLRYVGSAWTDETNTRIDAAGYRWKKRAYSVLDLAATWRGQSSEFTLALDNAFDRDYVTGFFWHGEPRTLRGEFVLHF